MCLAALNGGKRVRLSTVTKDPNRFYHPASSATLNGTVLELYDFLSMPEDKFRAWRSHFLSGNFRFLGAEIDADLTGLDMEPASAKKPNKQTKPVVRQKRRRSDSEEASSTEQESPADNGNIFKSLKNRRLEGKRKRRDQAGSDDYELIGSEEDVQGSSSNGYFLRSHINSRVLVQDQMETPDEISPSNVNATSTKMLLEISDTDSLTASLRNSSRFHFGKPIQAVVPNPNRWIAHHYAAEDSSWLAMGFDTEGVSSYCCI